MRVAVKKILRKHGYPPDMEAKATETVLEQARMMANGFSKARTYSLPESGELGMVAED
jgi:type I restriction enzyme R subunit